MKNVKKLLIFAAISTFVFASSTRTDALGGAGYWADDYANVWSFPASVNDHNVAYTNGKNFTSIFDKDGTTWGVTAGTGDDVANIMWGNGNMGVTFGLAMTPEVKADATTDPATDAADAVNAIKLGFGMPLAGGDFGFTYNTTGGGTMGINMRRSQSIWVWDSMLINFANTSDDTDTDGTDESTMDLDVACYSNTAYDGGTNALFGLAFNYGSVGDDDMMGITWTFAVESAMTDWATLRIGYSHGYDFQEGGTDSDTSGGVTAGLGFNYGSFTMDMTLTSVDDLLNDPVVYMSGRNTGADNSLGSAWTISYTW